ncbi:hypothetical protein CFE70_010083 [Pyrenophora teres f. teres 0-1]
MASFDSPLAPPPLVSRQERRRGVVCVVIRPRPSRGRISLQPSSTVSERNESKPKALSTGECAHQPHLRIGESVQFTQLIATVLRLQPARKPLAPVPAALFPTPSSATALDDDCDDCYTAAAPPPPPPMPGMHISLVTDSAIDQIASRMQQESRR